MGLSFLLSRWRVLPVFLGVVQRFADELVESLPEVDLFVGSGSATTVPEMVEELPPVEDEVPRAPNGDRLTAAIAQIIVRAKTSV